MSKSSDQSVPKLSYIKLGLGLKSVFCSNFSLLMNWWSFAFSPKQFAGEKQRQSLFLQAPFSSIPSLAGEKNNHLYSAHLIYSSVVVSPSFPRNQRRSWPKNICLQSNLSHLKSCWYLRERYRPQAGWVTLVSYKQFKLDYSLLWTAKICINGSFELAHDYDWALDPLCGLKGPL